jgi:hypothetical protein
VKNTLLKAIKDVPTYAKTIRELCIKSPIRKRKEPPPPPPTIQAIGQLIELMSGRNLVEMYVDLGNLVVIVYINKVSI